MNFENGEIVLKNYKIFRKNYAIGGMSEVHLAKIVNNEYDDNSYDNVVVIKVIRKIINPKNQKDADAQWLKALDEYKLTWALKDHPNDNIARPIEWTQTDDSIIIITEFVSGPTLSKLLTEKKSLPINKAMDYFLQILNGIRALHKLNDKKTVIHRDLKTDNIIVSNDYRQVKIIDYGIATSFYDGRFSTNEGTIYCTANYTTPDVLKLKPQILDAAIKGDKKAIEETKKIITTQFDFHALGVILYEMITGELPFVETERDNDRTKIQKWLNYDIPSVSNQIPNVPNSIENIIFRCVASMDSDKKYRYKDIDEIIDDAKTWNDESRKKEPLIKPLEKRVFQKKQIFQIDKLKTKEAWYLKWWFFITILVVSLLIIVTSITIITLSFLDIINF